MLLFSRLNRRISFVGKYDVMQNSAIYLRALEGNISFHVIDLLHLLKDPSYHKLWDNHLSKGLEAGEIVPLPTHVFEAERVVDAFRFMSQAKHIGKVLIRFSNTFSPTIQPMLQAKGRHLITGGLGGFALELAKRLSSRGCDEVILNTTSRAINACAHAIPTRGTCGDWYFVLD